MMAHADETDDSNEKSLTHPGCAVMPAALAAAEREGVDGMAFLKGVVAGLRHRMSHDANAGCC